MKKDVLYYNPPVEVVLFPFTTSTNEPLSNAEIILAEQATSKSDKPASKSVKVVNNLAYGPYPAVDIKVESVRFVSADFSRVLSWNSDIIEFGDTEYANVKVNTSVASVPRSTPLYALPPGKIKTELVQIALQGQHLVRLLQGVSQC